MLIAICGPEATGKTTLAESLAAATDTGVLPDARASLLGGYTTLWEAARHRPVWSAWIDAQVAREEATSSAVIDTCALDAWTLFTRWGWGDFSPARVEAIERRCRAAVERYDRIVVTPPRQVAGFASHRFLNEAHARRVHRLALAWIREWGAHDRTVVLEPGSPESMAAAALEGIGS